MDNTSAPLTEQVSICTGSASPTGIKWQCYPNIFPIIANCQTRLKEMILTLSCPHNICQTSAAAAVYTMPHYTSKASRHSRAPPAAVSTYRIPHYMSAWHSGVPPQQSIDKQSPFPVYQSVHGVPYRAMSINPPATSLITPPPPAAWWPQDSHMMTSQRTTRAWKTSFQSVIVSSELCSGKNSTC